MGGASQKLFEDSLQVGWAFDSNSSHLPLDLSRFGKDLQVPRFVPPPSIADKGCAAESIIYCNKVQRKHHKLTVPKLALLDLPAIFLTMKTRRQFFPSRCPGQNTILQAGAWQTDPGSPRAQDGQRGQEDSGLQSLLLRLLPRLRKLIQPCKAVRKIYQPPHRNCLPFTTVIDGNARN